MVKTGRNYRAPVAASEIHYHCTETQAAGRLGPCDSRKNRAYVGFVRAASQAMGDEENVL